MKKRNLLTGTFAWLLVAALGTSVSSAESLPPPSWNVGLSWCIETESHQPQTDVPDTKWTAQWQFTVEAIDQFENSDCFRLVIAPREHPEPKTTVWVECQTFMIRRVDSQIPTPHGYTTVSERYHANQPVPVVGPLSLIPLALPRFTPDGVKSGNEAEHFEYNNSDHVGIKSDSEVAFMTAVSQTVSKPDAESMKLFNTSPYVKSTDQPDVFEVKLATQHETVRQLWDASSPWPVYSENGTSTSRLLEVAASEAPQTPVERAIVPDVENLLARITNNTDDDTGVKSVEENTNREHGVASYKPWSGPWWPMRNGGLNVPLGKYDKITGHSAVAWEKQHNLAGNFRELPGWFGFCHAWAAASILEKEPRNIRNISVNSGQVSLEIGDQKGIVTACHTRDLANSWGTRFNEGSDQEDYDDLSPEELWHVLNQYVGKHGVPIVLDIELGAQVWNFPVYEYDVKYRSSGDKYEGVMTILLADDAVAPDYLGTQVLKKTYTFTFRMKDGCILDGSAQWTGKSIDDHPDFAWSPYKCVAQNPEVKHDKVVQLVYHQQHQPESAPDTPAPAVDVPPVSTLPVATTQPSQQMTQQTAQQQVSQEFGETAPVQLSSVSELIALVGSKTSSFISDVTVDRFDGAEYRPGETFFVRMMSERAGYLTLILIGPDGIPKLLTPQMQVTEEMVARKTAIKIPVETLSEQSSQNSFLPVMQVFQVPAKEGDYRIKAYVTEKPIQFSSIQTQINSVPTGQQTTQQTARQDIGQQVQIQDQSQSNPMQQQTSETHELIDIKMLGEFSQDEVIFFVTQQPHSTNLK